MQPHSGSVNTVSNMPHPPRIRYQLTDYLFWLMMLFANIPEVLTLTPIGDTMFKPYRVIALVLCVLCLPRLLKLTPVAGRFLFLLVVALVYALVVTALFASQVSLFANLPLVASTFALFIASFGVTSRSSLIIGLKCFLVSYALCAAYGILDYNSGGYFRVAGLLENPNSMGLAASYTFLILLNQLTPLSKTTRWVSILLLIPTVVLTGSRGSMLAVVAIYLAKAIRDPKTAIALVTLILVVFIGLPMMEETVSDTVESHGVFKRLTMEKVEKGGAGRLAIISRCLQVGFEHGFVGIGLGQYKEEHHAKYFVKLNKKGEVQKLSSHNIFATLLTDWGAVAFICFVLMYKGFFDASRGLKLERDWVIGILVITFFKGMGDDLTGEIAYWIMLGVTVQLLNFTKIELERRKHMALKNER